MAVVLSVAMWVVIDLLAALLLMLERDGTLIGALIAVGLIYLLVPWSRA